MAAGKLQEVLPQRPITYKGQNLVNLGLLAIAIGIGVALVLHPDKTFLFPFMIGIPLAFGVMMIIPIGGADMPTVISLLNSSLGFRRRQWLCTRQQIMIVAGALDGLRASSSP